MDKIVTSIDQHGRMLIPAEIRNILNIKPGDKINLEVHKHQIKIISAEQAIDEMNAIFTKNKKNNSAVDDFINQRRAEYKLEEKR